MGLFFWDQEDKQEIEKWFGSKVPPAPEYLDLVPDGVIDIYDVTELTKRLGQPKPALYILAGLGLLALIVWLLS